MGTDRGVSVYLHGVSDGGRPFTLYGDRLMKLHIKPQTQYSQNSNAAQVHIKTMAGSPGREKRVRRGASPSMRDRDRDTTKYAKDVDVHYLNNIRSFREKLKASCGKSGCSQDQCPSMQQRLHLHIQQHHSSTFKTLNYNSNQLSNNVMITPVSKEPLSKPCSTLTMTPRNGTQVVQTDLKTDFLKKSFENMYKDVTQVTDFNTNTIPLRRSETREVLPKRNLYKHVLTSEIRGWLKDIPLCPDLSEAAEAQKNETVNNLINNISDLFGESNINVYEDKVKIEIDNCLQALPIWYPPDELDLGPFKESLKVNLWSALNRLKRTFLNKATSQEQEKISDVPKQTELRFFMNGHESDIEKELIDWLNGMKLKNVMDGKPVHKKEVLHLFLSRLAPFLSQPMHTTNYKLILKGEIVEILNDLPVCLNCPKNRNLHINRFAEDLATKLLILQAKYRIENQEKTNTRRVNVDTRDTSLKENVFNIVSDCIKTTNLEHRHDIMEEITNIVIESIDSLKQGEYDVRDELFTFLYGFCGIIDNEASNIAYAIVQRVNKVVEDQLDTKSPTNSLLKPRLSGVLAVYASKHDISETQYPVTSTPIKKRSKKDLARLNPEEKSYMDQVSALIRSWMDTLPKQFNDNKDFKETMVYDLAGHVMDDAKLDQLLTPVNEEQKITSLLRFVNRWLLKFDVFDDLNDAKPQVATLVSKLLDIPVPQMTRPQHGNRQAMDNIQYTEANPLDNGYTPNAGDVLEDEISIWINEQPSDIYSTNDKSVHNKMVHELAVKLRKPLVNKKQNDISKEINQWLKKLVKADQKKNIGDLAVSLKDRIDKVPQDATLNANAEQRRTDREEKNTTCCNPDDRVNISQICVGNSEADVDKTLREFIGKYIQHNYEVDDTMARAAFSQLLKIEFQKLSPPTRKEVYDNFAKSGVHEQLSPERLGLELQYIKDISDWLKNIPIESSFNRPGNKERVEYVNSLAREIVDIEDQRVKDPNAMDYDMYLSSVIGQYLKQVPILPQHRCNADFMVEELLSKIAATRRLMPCCSKAVTKISTPQNTRENMSEFIEQYIHENGKEIADDEVKMEAWSARLMKEMKKIVNETSDPSALYKSNVYSKFNEVPLPADESVRQFSLKLDYVKEICDWIKNLPLLSMVSNPEAQENRVRMISELAEKMLQRHNSKAVDPSNEHIDSDFEEFVTQWVSQLPMDQRKQIDCPIITQQLINRMDRLNQPKKERKDSDVTKISSNRSIRSIKSSKTTLKSKSKTSNVSKAGRSSSCGGPNAGDLVVEAIDKWANNLPIKDADGIDAKVMKDNIARRMYQKVGEFNVDPRIFNDDMLYRDMLADEIDTQLENIPQSSDLQKNRDKIKRSLIDSVIDAKYVMKEISAADDYKQKLENTIEASIPNPVQPKYNSDPGFEIYKNRMAEMFILDNFDHGNDAVKMKYEKRIRSEVDKYFHSAQNKNLIPLNKDQIYNELYGALFKVPIPNETSIVDEVEEVKTRCEIDAWFEELPLREATGLGELLEWDKILATLAKRIREIEKSECIPDERIHKEVTKWLFKLPLISCQVNRVNEFADKLQSILKATAEARKCVKPSQITSKTSLKGKKDKSKSVLGISHNAGFSNPGKNWMSPPASSNHPLPCCQGLPQKKPAEIILDIVENWCEQLPLSANTPMDEENNRQIKETLATKIIIKISELNISPLIFNDDLIYDDLLDDELEKLFTELPICCEFQQLKEPMKDQLKTAIRAVKPLIKEEKARHEYKQELYQTVGSVLGEPQNSTEEMIALFNKITEEIVESFVEYNYNKDHDEGKQFYKMKVNDAVLDYFSRVMEKIDMNNSTEFLMKRNELLCELAKIPIPNGAALKEEVQEIRMKNEVKEFFDGLGSFREDEEKIPLVSQMKTGLARRLHDIEKSGHNCSNQQKMKNEISRCMKKLEKEVDQDSIEAFVSKLKKNEAMRKAPPPRKNNCVCPNDDTQNMSLYDGQDMSLFNVSPSYNPSAQIQYNATAGMHMPAPQNLCCQGMSSSAQKNQSLTPSCCQSMPQGTPVQKSCCQGQMPQSNAGFRPASIPGAHTQAGQPPFYQPNGSGGLFPPAPCQQMIQDPAWNTQRSMNSSSANYTSFASGAPCCSSKVQDTQSQSFSPRNATGQYLSQPNNAQQSQRNSIQATANQISRTASGRSRHSLAPHAKVRSNIQNSSQNSFSPRSVTSSQSVQRKQNEIERKASDRLAAPRQEAMDFNDDELCICGGLKKKGRGRRPCYYIPMREYCDECDDFSPVLCAMPYPDCFYY